MAVMVGFLFTFTSTMYEVKLALSNWYLSSPSPTTVDVLSKLVMNNDSIQLLLLQKFVQFDLIFSASGPTS